jgi:hypothetical protein
MNSRIVDRLAAAATCGVNPRRIIVADSGEKWSSPAAIDRK